jgi:hypothetical protein
MRPDLGTPRGNPAAAPLSIPALRDAFVALGLVAALTLIAFLPAVAQSGKHEDRDHHGMSVHVGDGSDSTSWLTRRLPAGVADATLRTRGREVEMLLTDTALVLQMTDRGLRRMKEGVDDDASRQSAGARIFAKMIGAGLGEMFDHGIGYRLSALREARADGDRLVLLDLEGKRVFDEVEINGRNALEDLSPAEARWFANEVNRAIRRRR